MATINRPSSIFTRSGAAAILALLLAACASGPESPTASSATPAVGAQPAADSEGAAALTEEQLAAQRAEEAAERARQAAEAERQRQAELARQQAEAERRAEEERQRLAEQQRLEEERLERERLAALAAEREAKLARIEELETQIAELQEQVAAGDALSGAMREAVLVSEQLLTLLTEEQVKYEEDNLDAAGNLVDPPATDAIAELEARRDGLLDQIDTC